MKIFKILKCIGRIIYAMIFGNISRLCCTGNKDIRDRSEYFNYDENKEEIIEFDKILAQYHEYAEANNKASDTGLQLTLLSAQDRLRMLAHLRPDRSLYSNFQNIALVMAVKDTVHQFLLVRTYYMSGANMRCDELDDYGFAIITKAGVYNVRCKNFCGKHLCDFSTDVFCPISAKHIKAAVKFHMDYKNLQEFEAMMKNRFPEFSLNRLEFRIQRLIFPRDMWL